MELGDQEAEKELRKDPDSQADKGYLSHMERASTYRERSRSTEDLDEIAAAEAALKEAAWQVHDIYTYLKSCIESRYEAGQPHRSARPLDTSVRSNGLANYLDVKRAEEGLKDLAKEVNERSLEIEAIPFVSNANMAKRIYGAIHSEISEISSALEEFAPQQKFVDDTFAWRQAALGPDAEWTGAGYEAFEDRDRMLADKISNVYGAYEIFVKCIEAEEPIDSDAELEARSEDYYSEDY
jgi:hypothetical protein